PNSKPEDEWGVKPNPGYEVKLTDEERYEYHKDRRDRDIIRRPGQAAKPPEKTDKADKKKEPFKDRVLEKALEYIRGELKKDNKQGAQAPARPQPQPEAAPAESGAAAYFRPLPAPSLS